MRARKRLVALGSLLAISLCAPSVVQANHPDVVDAAVAAKIVARTSPDALERAVTATPRPLAPAQEVFERAVARKVATSASSDAFVRGVESLRPGRVEGTEGRSRVASVPAPRATGRGFQWNDFGVGAAAGIGLVLVLGGLGFGLAAGRHDGRRVRST